MDPITRALLMGAAGSGGTAKTYVEDVFSTWLYTGNGSTQTITNGIDLAGEGGLVWIKARNQAYGNRLLDSARTNWRYLESNSTNAENVGDNRITPNSDGFTLNSNSAGAEMNVNTATYASWTFRKAEKFFDVVTWTGNYPTQQPRDISHNLGSTPGCVIIKRTSSNGNWGVWHRSISTGTYAANNTLFLQSTDAAVNYGNVAGPFTSTTIRVGEDLNQSGQTYVAYLFAHDAGGFGDDGNQSVIKCGSVVTGSGGVTDVSLGWEPQWVLLKVSSEASGWYLVDNMRGFITYGTSGSQSLFANNSNAESGISNFGPTADGFKLSFGGTSGINLIYIAIRRGPMKTPTDATKVFGAQTANQAGTGLYVDIGAPLDALWLGLRGGSSNNALARQRLTASNYLVTSSTAAEVSNSVPMWQTMRGAGGGSVGTDTTVIGWGFRRAPGFFDVVAYTGTGVALNVTHNLGVTPELMIIKQRSAIQNWIVYSAGVSAPTTSILRLNTTGAVITGITTHWSSTAPTSTSFTVGNDTDVNQSAGTYIAYLFASCPGVSKCFSFTGNGTSQTIDCGFAAGAKFVLIKRTDSTGNWLVADTARGIVSGNDPLLYLNSTAAEITTLDWIDPDNSGFIVNQEATANANVNGATYIGLAIA